MNNSKLTTYQKKLVREDIRSWRFFVVFFYSLSAITAAASFFAWWLMLVSLAFAGLSLISVHAACRLVKHLEDNQ